MGVCIFMALDSCEHKLCLLIFFALVPFRVSYQLSDNSIIGHS